MTPVFTSGKLRGMVPLIDQVGDKLVEYVKCNRHAEEIELKQLFSMYGMEVIATTGLGFESNIFSDPESIFKDKVEKLNGTGKYVNQGLTSLRLFFMSSLPKVSQWLKLGLIEKDVLEFFVNICKSQLDRRQRGLDPKRNDFLDVMLEGLKTPIKSVASEEQSDIDAELKGGKQNRIGPAFSNREELEVCVVSN